MGKLLSGVQMKPVRAFSDTGEPVSLNEVFDSIWTLISYTQTEATRLLDSRFDEIVSAVKEYKKISPAEFSRQKGFIVPGEAMPKEAKVKSRINKLIGHSLVTTASGYVENTNPRKKHPTIPHKISLGAVDKAMAGYINVEPHKLMLTWKCWDRTYLIEFSVPDYIIQKRNVSKWSLPDVRIKNGNIVFDFIYWENPEPRTTGKHTAGIDLGRREPFVAAVVNEKGNRVAHYVASGHIKSINDKRERLIREVKHIAAKIDAFDKLRLEEKKETLEKEITLTRRKASALGKAVAREMAADLNAKLKKHDVHTLNMEDLRYVPGSRWNQGEQQKQITHTVAREGIKTRRVYAAYTSQKCHVCGEKITHNSATRKVRCKPCQTTFDRDFNAAMNIAKKTPKTRPAAERTTGVTCRQQGNENHSHESMLTDPVLVGNTT